MDNYEAKKMIVQGKLAEYFSIPNDIRSLERRKEEIRRMMGAVHSPRFGEEASHSSGKTRDEKLADYLTKMQDIDDAIAKKSRRQKRLYAELRFQDMTLREKQIVEAVFTFNSYYKAGEVTGYSKSQIYRTMNRIYRDRIEP